MRLYRCLTACHVQEGSVRTKRRACLLQDAECRGEHALLLILISALLQQRLHIQLETFRARRKKYVPLHLSHGTPVVTFTASDSQRPSFEAQIWSTSGARNKVNGLAFEGLKNGTGWGCRYVPVHLEEVLQVGRPDTSSVIHDDHSFLGPQHDIQVLHMLHSAVPLHVMPS